MKLIARIFVIMRKNRPPSMVTTEAYIKRLTHVEPDLKVFKFLKTEDASLFLSNLNLQLDESKRDTLVNETQIRQRVEKELNDRLIRGQKQQPGFSIQRDQNKKYYVGFKEGQDFPDVYRSKSVLTKMGYNEEHITLCHCKKEAQQFVVDILKKQTNSSMHELADQTDKISLKEFVTKEQNIEEDQNTCSTTITHIPDSPLSQEQLYILTTQQQQDLQSRFDKMIQLNEENKSVFKWYHLQIKRSANPMLTYRLFFDGSTQMKNGETNSSSGVVIYEGEKRFYKIGIYVGSAKSNGAEIHGLLYGMRIALELGITKLDVFGDSELIIKFMQGRYKVKDEVLKTLFLSAKQYEKIFQQITYTSIPREMNEEADEIANKSRDKFMRYLQEKKKPKPM